MTSLMKQLKTRGSATNVKEIDVSELFPDGGGEKVYVRQMRLADREWMMAAMRSVGQGENAALMPTMEARCRQIVRCLADANGKRLWTDIDVEGLMTECESGDIDLIGARIDAKLGERPSVEDAEKN